MKIKQFILLYLIISLHFFAQNNYYVSTSGSDSNDGSFSNPWLTIQHAADNVSAGDSVIVRAGVYNETVTVNVSGNPSDGFIVFKNYENEQPIVDGTGLSVPSADNGLFLIKNRNYIVIQGFELRNYKTNVKNNVPSAVFITGTSHDIKIISCLIHNIEHNGNFNNGVDAHGIAVYGRNSTVSINHITISNNTMYDLKLGSSEALVVNGNVEQFTISKNTIHDIDNIAIDCIGFEGTASANDQARNGKITDNLVFSVSSISNHAYNFSYGADGIYVDGGKDIIIDRNIVHNADVGIELASEHYNKFTSNITVRNNLVYYCNIAGISLGGYNATKGNTDSCKIINNTLYYNDSQNEGNGEIWLQYHIRHTTIENNILNANSQAILIANIDTSNTNSIVDNNLYFSPNGANNSTWIWKANEYYEFSSYQTGTGNDINGMFNNPLFVNTLAEDFHLNDNSPAINSGDNSVDAGSNDLDGNPRLQNSIIDLGAYETLATVLLSVKIFLEGPYNLSTNQMSTALHDDIPLTSPYPEDARSVNSIPEDVVDWVLVQLRETSGGNTITSKSAFLHKDGRVVADDGTTGEIELNAAEGDYYIVIKHRNHLAVMSSHAVSLNSTTSTLYDFTTGSDQFYGTGGSIKLKN